MCVCVGGGVVVHRVAFEAAVMSAKNCKETPPSGCSFALCPFQKCPTLNRPGPGGGSVTAHLKKFGSYRSALSQDG